MAKQKTCVPAYAGLQVKRHNRSHVDVVVSTKAARRYAQRYGYSFTECRFRDYVVINTIHLGMIMVSAINLTTVMGNRRVIATQFRDMRRKENRW